VKLLDDPDVVALNVLSVFIESCVWSISRSDVQTVEQAIQTFSFSVEITSIFSVEVTLILGEVIIIICPGQPMCGGHGSCVNAVCLCDTGINFFCYMLSPLYLNLSVRHVVRNTRDMQNRLQYFCQFCVDDGISLAS